MEEEVQVEDVEFNPYKNEKHMFVTKIREKLNDVELLHDSVSKSQYIIDEIYQCLLDYKQLLNREYMNDFKLTIELKLYELYEDSRFTEHTKLRSIYRELFGSEFDIERFDSEIEKLEQYLGHKVNKYYLDESQREQLIQMRKVEA